MVADSCSYRLTAGVRVHRARDSQQDGSRSQHHRSRHSRSRSPRDSRDYRYTSRDYSRPSGDRREARDHKANSDNRDIKDDKEGSKEHKDGGGYDREQDSKAWDSRDGRGRAPADRLASRDSRDNKSLHESVRQETALPKQRDDRPLDREHSRSDRDHSRSDRQRERSDREYDRSDRDHARSDREYGRSDSRYDRSDSRHDGAGREHGRSDRDRQHEAGNSSSHRDAAAAEPIDAAGPVPPKPSRLGLGRCYNVDSKMAQECLRRSVFVSKRREDVVFDRSELEKDTLLVLWDVERRELYGMFRPDVAAEKLPRHELPGYERNYDCQVGT